MASMPPQNPPPPQTPPPGYPPPGYQQQPYQQPYPQQGYPPQPYPPRKKSNALAWILGIIGVLFLLLILAVGGGIFFIRHKMHQAGLDPTLMRRNPTLAAARLAAAMNPNIEVLSTNEDRGILTVRDKKNGKVFTVNFEDAKNGRWTMTEDGKTTEVTTSGQGPGGTFEVKSSDGTSVRVGGAANLPSWVPQYPGSKPENAVTSNQGAESGGMVAFKTTDAVDRVMNYYQEQLKGAGFKITNTTTAQNQGIASGAVTAEDEASKRTIGVTVTSEGGENSVLVTYSTKK